MSNSAFGSKEVSATGRGRSKYRVLILPLLLVFCSLLYYFGELVDWAAWTAVREKFFYGVHDIHRLLFLAPIIYAGYTARVRGAIIITVVTFIIFLPRAFFISPFPDPLLRMILFTIIAGVVGSLTGVIHNQTDRYRRLETAVRSERDKLSSIIDNLADGVLITGPDYRIRFMNASMVKEFGDGTGLPCYRHLHGLDAPCEQECRIPDVIGKGEIGKWECDFPDGRAYEVVAAPYIDADGMVCQLSIFRNVTGLKRA